MDYEYEAYRKGFNDGMVSLFMMFHLDKDDDNREFLKDRIDSGEVNDNIYSLYYIWQGFINDNKIRREEVILEQKIEERTKKLKEKVINYIDSVKV